MGIGNAITVVTATEATTGMSDFTPKPGDRYDPVEAAKNGFYPEDVVDARTDLRDGPKRVFSRFIRIAKTADRRRNPWKGYIFPSIAYMAKLLGKSGRGIERDVAVLVEDDLIEIERPNRTEFNCYYFTWKDEFDTTKTSCRADGHEATLPSSRPDQQHTPCARQAHAGDTTDMTPRHDTFGSFDTTDPSRAYKEDLGVDLGVDLKSKTEDISVRSRKTRASRRRAHAFSELPIPKNQLGNQQSTWAPGSTQRDALRENLKAWAISDVPLDEETLQNIMEAGVRHGATVDQIIELCDDRICGYIKSRSYGKKPIEKPYGYMLRAVADHFRIEKQKRQGLAHPIPDLDDAKFDAMTEALG